jgi:hypothetical protein
MYDFCALFSYFLALEHNKYTLNGRRTFLQKKRGDSQQPYRWKEILRVKGARFTLYSASEAGFQAVGGRWKQYT